MKGANWNSTEDVTSVLRDILLAAWEVRMMKGLYIPSHHNWTSQPPLCAVCNKPVEYFWQEYIPSRRVTIFTANCHGDTQVNEVADSVLANGIIFSKAFEEED